MFNAILWIARIETSWRDLPERYGPWKTVYSRFCNWRDDGTSETMFKQLNTKIDLDYLSIDSTVLVLKNAIIYAVNQYISKSRGGYTTKMHVVIDDLGNLITLSLISCSIHDSQQSIPLLSTICLEKSNALGDRGYGSKEIRTYIKVHGATYTIP